MKKPPAAPPVYRPQLNAAQAKAASSARQNPSAPLGPQVYRPQSLPKVLQAKGPLNNPDPAVKQRQPIISSGPQNHLRPNTAKPTTPVNRVGHVPPPPHTNGSVQRQTISRQPVEIKPPNANRAIAQLKPNAAVSLKRSNTTQRRLRVTDIDFDPVANQPRHATADGTDQAQFVLNFKNEINTVARYAPYRGQLNNVMNAVVATANAGAGIQAVDVPSLSTAIATEVINEYTNRHLPAIANLRVHLEEAIARLLIPRFQVAHGVVMNGHEQGAYDQLRAIVTDAHMERRKGHPSLLNHNQLPALIQAGVDTVLNDIRTERRKWRNTGRRLNVKYFLPAPNEEFCVEIINRQRGKRYQGNHTNNAGWLPAAAAAPANAVTTAQANVLAAASAGLTAILTTHGNAIGTLQLGVAGTAPTAFGVEFLGLVHAERANLNAANVEASVGAALAQGVSSFVEFSMPGHISRLVWDVVTNDIYISAHYKWRLGYNPWFKINNYPAI